MKLGFEVFAVEDEFAPMLAEGSVLPRAIDPDFFRVEIDVDFALRARVPRFPRGGRGGRANDLSQ
jgi:hypothetical protein